MIRGMNFCRALPFVFAVLLFLLVDPANAATCTCGHMLSPEREFDGATAVFIGTPVSVVPGESSGLLFWLRDKWFQFRTGWSMGSPYASGAWESQPRMNFEAHEAWKGVTDPDVVVAFGDPSVCGYPFKLGEKYLVYAVGGAKLTTSQCLRTQPLAVTTDDLAFLRGLDSVTFKAKPDRFIYVVVILAGVAVAGLVALDWLFRRRSRAASARK
jgi:hypothetical protein